MVFTARKARAYRNDPSGRVGTTSGVDMFYVSREGGFLKKRF